MTDVPPPAAQLDLTRLRVLAAVARTGSVTAAARELHYAQPSVSHHLARLETEAGIPLLQRAGRGVRLTEAGRLLADRAGEIIARVEGAQRELDALAGLRAGRARLAAFPSALATIVPEAVTRLRSDHPGIGVSLVEAEPPEAVAALRSGEVDVALVFEHADVRHARAVDDLSRFQTTRVLDDTVHLVTASDGRGPAAGSGDSGTPLLRAHEDDAWIAGCERCRADLLARCAAAGFAPRLAFETDDYVAVQALVAAGAGVSLLPGLALRAHRNPQVATVPLPGARRSVLALTVGAPTPPAAALVERLVAAGHP
ncbi:DNA-binding transcriptional LysR family regulator [Isoptericola sp. CG 20/1183]|uniref:DNA-binding transcriptional LysR family regulator n=1 Tax=Isoptericola halotolerans TaxID=300560 RepID=A0ABX5EBD3_9MICO|nr:MULTISPECIES: LysR family transcriptional regulator [Isoptericola]MCK0115411.1 LysR family transcriptional regulator [Isoptericola sp. S6320L]PRZ04517.1 DNA-binding transcriptional LysR family regulator [Isoptericola halotolerans]PRZ04585.1 DNA-binding transcriptional LysR family regulator [Isoptericola sp. CG 20/1183]